MQGQRSSRRSRRVPINVLTPLSHVLIPTTGLSASSTPQPAPIGFISVLYRPLLRKGQFSRTIWMPQYGGDLALGDAWSHLWRTDANSMAPPAWVLDPNVRLGIRHMLFLDRIREERNRLVMEEQNMEHWLSQQVTTLHQYINENEAAGKI